MFFVADPGVVQEVACLRPLPRIVLQTPIDEVAALWRHLTRYIRSLSVRQLPLQRHMHVAFAVEADAPRVLPREHLDDEAAKRPNVRPLPHLLHMRLWRHPSRGAVDERVDTVEAGRQICRLLRLLEQHGVTHVAQLYFFAVLAHEHVRAFQVPMHEIILVQVEQRAQHLLCVHARVFLADFSVLAAHLCHALVHVLQVDTQHVVFYYLRIVILDDVLVVELFVPLDLLLNSFHFLLVETQVRVHQFDHFDGESFPCVDIERLVDLACGTSAQRIPHLPLYHLPVELLARSGRLQSFLSKGRLEQHVSGIGAEKVVLLFQRLLLFHKRKEGSHLLRLAIIHIKLLVDQL
mmetsp:Transcript_8506/g.10489  ORF Transcript_8506/g.10489 Transcript_8506/m.10489 type:complete len:349 (+) Transcript_8506:466-1512(+)